MYLRATIESQVLEFRKPSERACGLPQLDAGDVWIVTMLARWRMTVIAIVLRRDILLFAASFSYIIYVLPANAELSLILQVTRCYMSRTQHTVVRRAPEN